MSAVLFWKAPEGENVLGYVITVDGKPVGTTELTRFRIGRLTPDTSYNLGVFAYDGHDSSVLASVPVTLPSRPDHYMRPPPDALSADPLSHEKVLLTWNEPVSPSPVIRYIITVGGRHVGATGSTRFHLDKLLAATDYDIGVVANYGLRLGHSDPATASVRTPDAPRAGVPSPAPEPADSEDESPTTGAATPDTNMPPGVDPDTGLPTHAPDGTPYCD